MRRYITKKTGLLFVIGALFVGVFIMNLYQAQESGEQVVPVVPAGASVLNPEASIQYLEEMVRKKPDNRGYQLSLAQTYLQYAVQTRMEPVYIPKAEDVLHDLLKADPNLYEARALQASLYNSLHQFEKARDLSSELIEENEKASYVYGILVDALVELGEYEEAVAVCDKMISIKPGLASYARASYLRELHGDSEGAMAAMKLAADAGLQGSEERSWALYQVGQLYLGENKLQEAAAIFSGLLEEYPQYAFAIGGLGHVQLIEGAHGVALDLFKAAYGLVPADEFLEGMVEAYTALGDDAAMYAALDQLEKSLQEADRMGENVQMEYADFLADVDQKLPKALRWAKSEYERRPNHLHALETYAWTLHKSGQSAEAVPYIERAMRLGTGDAMVLFRAAEIYRGAGDTEKARGYLQEALDGNLHIESPSTAEWAQRLYQQLS